jgi:hypothetical protein
MQPGRFTELFFLDEATAFAAGHRPCALCRREDYNLFLGVWATLQRGRASADEIDAQLHDERVDSVTRAQRRHSAKLDDLPDGAFVLRHGDPHLVLGSRLHRWTPSGYATPLPRHGGEATLLTPPSLVAVLRTGWQPVVPLFHPTAAA